MTNDGKAPMTDDAEREARRKRRDQVNDWLYIGGALPAEEYSRLHDAGITRALLSTRGSSGAARVYRDNKLRSART